MPQHSFLQTDIWGSFRESLGWHAYRVGEVLVLERPLPLGKSFLYSPEVTGSPELLLTVLPEIYRIANRRQSIFYRLELLVDKRTPLADRWQSAFRYTHFEPSFESVQPNDRQIISLSNREAAMLAQMKQKGRYNIRLAEKSGVMVRESTPKTLNNDIETFYALFRDTAKRDKFSIRPLSYFVSLVDLLYTHNAGRLFVASYNNQPLAAAIISLHDGVASYLYGASSNQERNVMAPYALHWTVMQWAVSKRATSYDLLAIAPEGASAKHPYVGITRFKEQFGGESLHLLGSWDLPLTPSWYALFGMLEKIRR